MLDRKAEGCLALPPKRAAARQVPNSDRTRIFDGADGRRMLGSMEVIRNEPSCYSAACHLHASQQSVLGVLDIVYSLDEIDQTMRASALRIAALLARLHRARLALRRLVRAPPGLRAAARPRNRGQAARRRQSGADDPGAQRRRVRPAGGLVQRHDRRPCANSQAELRDGAQTLEQKVEERTQELRVAQAEAARAKSSPRSACSPPASRMN